MMQELGSVPLLSNLMRSGAMILKRSFHPTVFTIPSRCIQLNNFSLLQSRIFVPCVINWNFRSFHSCHSFQTENFLSKTKSSILHPVQSPIYQTLHSITLHTTADRKHMLTQKIPNLQTSVGGFNLETLCHDLSAHNQIRFLHNHSTRRRINRTFSPNGKPSSTPNKDPEEKEEKDIAVEDDKKLSVFQRFKKAYKEHGKVLVVVHLLTSGVWFGSFYTAARCGVEIVPLLESWNLSEKVISPFRSGGLGDIALAYLMYKMATPARYTVTLGGTNLALRYLKKEGKMQPVAKEDSLRELYKDGKANFKIRSTTTRRRLNNMRHRIQGRMRRVQRRPPHRKKDS